MVEFLGGSFGILIILFLFILAILWFLLPFAIFGTKDKLDLLIAESRITNAELADIRAELVAARLELHLKSQESKPEINEA
jgi:hypothetical protein